MTYSSAVDHHNPGCVFVNVLPADIVGLCGLCTSLFSLTLYPTVYTIYGQQDGMECIAWVKEFENESDG